MLKSGGVGPPHLLRRTQPREGDRVGSLWHLRSECRILHYYLLNVWQNLPVKVSGLEFFFVGRLVMVNWIFLFSFFYFLNLALDLLVLLVSSMVSFLFHWFLFHCFYLLSHCILFFKLIFWERELQPFGLLLTSPQWLEWAEAKLEARNILMFFFSVGVGNLVTWAITVDLRRLLRGKLGLEVVCRARVLCCGMHHQTDTHPHCAFFILSFNLPWVDFVLLVLMWFIWKAERTSIPQMPTAARVSSD